MRRTVPGLVLGLIALGALADDASQDLPHDWSEQGQFLGFAGGTSVVSGRNAQTPDPKMALRDPAAVRALHPGVWRLW